MAFSVAKQAVASKAVVAGRSRRATVRVQANVPENVAEARAWIDNWKAKQGGAAGLTLRDPKMPHWFPGTPVPSYLDGTTLVGDFGFDPLRLGADPAKLKWYVQAEVFHGRTAMLGVAGVLFPELLKGAGLGGPAAQVAWFEAGKFEYFAPPQALFISMMFMFAWVELRRWQDILKPGSVNQDPIFTNNKLPDGNEPGYPGGIFDPLGFAKGGNIKELRLKEIKNGRLAMLAFMGFWAASVTTGKTPLAALSQHLSDPWTNTVFDVEHARLLAQ